MRLSTQLDSFRLTFFWALTGGFLSLGALSAPPADSGGKRSATEWTGGRRFQVPPSSAPGGEGEASSGTLPVSAGAVSPVGSRASDLGSGVLSVDAQENGAGRSVARKQAGDKEAEGDSVQPLSIPLVPGYDSFGLTIPDHDEAGHLRSMFVIGAVSRLDDRRVEIRETFLETYKQDGSKDLCVDLPKATLDRFTRILSTSHPVRLRRDEFELKGASLEFNTLTRRGELNGPVEMTLYNFRGASMSAGPGSASVETKQTGESGSKPPAPQ